MFGVEDSENEAGAMQDALTTFGDANGIDITYVGRRDFEQQINAQVLGGNPPDIAAFPQPGKLKQFAKDGKLIKVPDDVVTSVKENWDDSYLAFYQRRRHRSTACRSSPTSSRSCGTSRACGRRRATRFPRP